MALSRTFIRIVDHVKMGWVISQGFTYIEIYFVPIRTELMGTH